MSLFLFITVYFLYNVLLVLALPATLIIVTFLGNKRLKDIIKRCHLTSLNAGTLFHGASVGEHNQTLPFRGLLNNIAYSVCTDTGLNKLRKYDVRRQFLPLDLPLLMIVFLRKLKKIVITESEINPNMILFSYLLGKELYLINAKMSDSRHFFYLLLKPFYRTLLGFFKIIMVADEDQKKRFSQFGLNTLFTGNTKYYGLRIKKKISEEIFLFASTHESDEDIILKSLKGQSIKDMILIIAPRHINRSSSIFKRFTGLPVMHFTAISEMRAGNIYIVKKMGLLDKLYERSRATFIGGAFSRATGGHNPLEPIVYKSFVITGPYHNNFKREMRTILKNGVGKVIKDEYELQKSLFDPLADVYEGGFENVLNTLNPDMDLILSTITNKAVIRN